jgi:hypothetical protein
MKPQSNYKKLTTYVSKDFRAMAKRFNLEPEYLVFLILADRTDCPPIGYTVLSDDPSDMRSKNKSDQAILRSDWRALKAKIKNNGTPGNWRADLICD